jgi:hypothetical protein
MPISIFGSIFGPRAVHTGYGHYTTASARIGTFYGPTLFS